MNRKGHFSAECAGAVAILLASFPTTAHAQRVAENVNTQASDAFGSSVGFERNGLYNQEDVRGFNPVDAGNVRVEGLYIDLIERFSGRLIEGNSIRVGLAAQRYPFPAPTGLVDFRLSLPQSNTVFSLDVDNGNGSGVRGPSANFTAKLPIDGGRLGIVLGAGARYAQRPEGATSTFVTYSALVAFRPAPGTELIAFTGGIISSRERARPTYFPAGTAPPPMLRRGVNLGLDWANRNSQIYTHGMIAKVALAPGWRINAGLFLSGKSADDSFSDLFLGVNPDGSAKNRLIIADGNNADRSLSGELRLTYEWTRGSISHTVTADLRGRAKDRLFGGTVNLPLGPGSIYSATGWTQPAFTLRPENEDHVRQLTAGVAYGLLWRGKASLDISLAKSTYKKTVNFANPLLADPVTTDRPLLWSVGGSIALSKNVILFGGVTRGQEDALIAPGFASNGAEAPPAIRTKQEEIGLSLKVTKRLTLIAAAFQITKPYFNLDPALRYRQLGTLTNKGIEISLTGKLTPGLTIVAGTLFLDPSIQGEAADAKLIGPRPVGQIRRRSQLNLDWRLQSGKSPLSLDLALESLSARMANAANTLQAPARTTFNIGARYRFSLGKLNAVFRPTIVNVTNNYGWQVSSSGGWTYTAPRAITLSLAADF